MKAKALKHHSLGFYSKGDVVDVKNDRFDGTYKVEVTKNNQVVARTTQPKRYFELLKEVI